jgi:hypothetical protein
VEAELLLDSFVECALRRDIEVENGAALTADEMVMCSLYEGLIGHSFSRKVYFADKLKLF